MVNKLGAKYRNLEIIDREYRQKNRIRSGIQFVANEKYYRDANVATKELSTRDKTFFILDKSEKQYPEVIITLG